jgi:hypothetical protein
VAEWPADGHPLSAPPQRTLRIVFSLLHSGYLRHYGDPIRLLCARGHSVHLALYRTDAKDRGDDRLLARLLADCPAVTAAAAPRRRRVDGWRPFSWMVRALVDVLRYADPRYRQATSLRERTAEKVRVRIAESRVDPLSRWLVLRVLAWVSGTPDAGRARRLIKWLGAVEAAIPTSPRVDRLLEEYGADLVLASPVVEIGSSQVEFVKSALALDIPNAICIASWDNLTNKGLLRVVPDRVIVWNEAQRRELDEMHGVAPDRVVITGGQKFDAWFDREPTRTRESFLATVQLDPTRAYLLYLCSSVFIAPDEVSFVHRWITAIRSSEREGVRGLGVLVRPHPQNAAQWADVDFGEFENVSIWPREGEYPDETASQDDFFDSVAYSAGVVGVNTTAQIEAGIVGKPVYTILDPQFAKTQSGTIHFHYLLHENGGFVHRASDIAEHLDQLAAGLDDPAATEATVRAFMGSFVRPLGIDRAATPIVAAALEDVALARKHRPRGTRVSSYVLRVALYPVALGMGIAAIPGALWYRLRPPPGRVQSGVGRAGG